jgi:hypothetical protein
LNIQENTMTDQELKDLVASLAVSQAKTDAQMAKTDAQMAKTDAGFAKLQAAQEKTDAQMAKSDAKLDKLTALYGGVSENLGAAAEEFFYNSLQDCPIVAGIQYDSIRQNTGVGTPKNFAEIDLWLENGSSVAIIEVKHKVHPKALDQLARQMQRVREFCPEYKDYKLYGGIAGFSIPDEVVEEAKARGMFILKCKGDLLLTDASSMRSF